MRIASGREYPQRLRSSSASSNPAVSLASGVQIGKILVMSPGRRSVARRASLARIQFRLPWTVLISPLWAIRRYGWARGHEGNVLVENLECTRAMALTTRSSVRSGKKADNCGVVSIPLYTTVRADSEGK